MRVKPFEKFCWIRIPVIRIQADHGSSLFSSTCLKFKIIFFPTVSNTDSILEVHRTWIRNPGSDQSACTWFCDYFQTVVNCWVLFPQACIIIIKLISTVSLFFFTQVPMEGLITGLLSSNTGTVRRSKQNKINALSIISNDDDDISFITYLYRQVIKCRRY